jgi:L-asparaginase
MLGFDGKKIPGNDIARIHVITTGGTIEKSYDEADGSLENRDSIIQSDIVAKLRLPYTQLSFHNLMSKDSLVMTEEDREIIYRQVLVFLEQGSPVVVLHGTDTMAKTAQYCHERVKGPKAPLVFTGAMRPLGFENSDAFQNVVEAIYAARHVTPGIYISFHGRLFVAPNVEKDKAKGTFAMSGANSV